MGARRGEGRRVYRPPLPQPCGKVGFRSQAHAERALTDFLNRQDMGEAGRREQRVYQCRLCFLWHTTSRNYDQAR